MFKNWSFKTLYTYEINGNMSKIDSESMDWDFLMQSSLLVCEGAKRPPIKITVSYLTICKLWSL